MIHSRRVRPFFFINCRVRPLLVDRTTQTRRVGTCAIDPEVTLIDLVRSSRPLGDALSPSVLQLQTLHRSSIGLTRPLTAARLWHRAGRFPPQTRQVRPLQVHRWTPRPAPGAGFTDHSAGKNRGCDAPISRVRHSRTPAQTRRKRAPCCVSGFGLRVRTTGGTVRRGKLQKLP